MKKNLGSISLISLLALSIVAAGCSKNETRLQNAASTTAAAATAATHRNTKGK